MNSKALLRQASQIAGGIWINGRHNRAPGFIADMEKYNEATLAGWRVFRLADVHITLEVVERIRDTLQDISQPDIKHTGFVG